ncbi:VOC family protein [Silvibacterium dinghuense]|uniref:VOC family protein n=1 Tax=Silvibacterium dinghuense TaxID=1560006 RepID=A0A4Q1SE62_9BACT|nr:VOC family protein [Silvibacterium dinghuense]RXS95544.1 VOC family protein [Silvibacterium dinghuense]GGH13901.1 virulence protein [Silvibacterium dinghuense]
MAFSIDRIDHLVLTVTNIPATCDFYSEVLGMEVESANGRTALLFGEQKINLHQRGHEFEPKAAHPMPGAADLCLITEAPMPEVVEYLAALRVHIEIGPVERNGAMGRMQSVYIRDPDRNLVEISNYE